MAEERPWIFWIACLTRRWASLVSALWLAQWLKTRVLKDLMVLGRWLECGMRLD